MRGSQGLVYPDRGSSIRPADATVASATLLRQFAPVGRRANWVTRSIGDQITLRNSQGKGVVAFFLLESRNLISRHRLGCPVVADIPRGGRYLELLFSSRFAIGDESGWRRQRRTVSGGNFGTGRSSKSSHPFPPGQGMFGSGKGGKRFVGAVFRCGLKPA